MSLLFHGRGKVILLGEHAVVYGHPALTGAIAEGVHVVNNAPSGTLHIPEWNVIIDPSVASDERPLTQAYRALLATLGIERPTPGFNVSFEVPAGAGLGSSAAMAIALARGLCELCRVDEGRIPDAAMAWETVIHGRPSGLDHTLSAQGGFGVFTRKNGLSRVSAKPIELVVGQSGKQRDTKARVARVAELYAERPDEVDARFNAIAELVERGRVAVESCALGELGEAMSENQRHLAALECSCPEIERMCAIAEEAGAIGAKLTGGGGGGCVIALAPGREQRVLDAWQTAGFDGRTVSVGN
jgi:mevalonate kinase